jgi:signal transduction histidine kinase
MKLSSGKIVEKGDDILKLAYSTEEGKRFKKSYEKAFAGESFTEVVNNESIIDAWSEISYCPIRKGNEVIGTACHSRDISERKKSEETLKQAEEDLKQSESSLKKAQAIAHIGNFEIDLINHSEVWSDQMYNILGVEKKLTPNRELFSTFIHPDDSGAAQEAFKVFKNASMDYRLIRKDGAVRYVNSEWRFEFGKNKKPIRLSGVLQDMTDRKLAEIERTKMANDMMIRNTELEQFAYIISHNLRAPVANIIGAAGALNDPDLSADDKEKLNKGINVSVMKLDNVVKDLNHILEVKAEINDTKEIVHFSTLANDIKFSIQNLVDKYGVEIKCDFSEINEFPTLRAYLYSIFYNLITNSIKYRRQQVHCLIEIKSCLEKNKLKLIFTDNGMGINLKKNGGDIFGLYKRFNTDIEGKGMGLFMVKTQVAALGGKIGVKSIENKGAEFTVEFEL